MLAHAAMLTALGVLFGACREADDVPHAYAAAETPGGGAPRTIPRADAERAPPAFARHGCGSCHVIPGVRGAEGLVGPSLAGFAERVYVAGTLPNEPANLVRWIRFPQAVEPGTAMPDLGVSEVEARDMAAYLYTLRDVPD